MNIIFLKVTKDVYEILKTRDYELSCRGTIPVKGKGKMETFFLERKLLKNNHLDENKNNLD